MLRTRRNVARGLFGVRTIWRKATVPNGRLNPQLPSPTVVSIPLHPDAHDGGRLAEAHGYVRMPPSRKLSLLICALRQPKPWARISAYPSKPCRMTAHLASKAYSSAGEGASALHAMAVLQMFQAKLLQSLEGRTASPEAVNDLQVATDFANKAQCPGDWPNHGVHGSPAEAYRLTLDDLKHRTRGCIEALTPWRNPDLFSRGVPLGSVASRVVVTTDALSHGWGAVCEGTPASGLWLEPQSRWHINRLEMEAVFLALKDFQPQLEQQHVLIRTENTSVVSYINHQGGIRSRALCKQATNLLLWADCHLLSIRATHIPGLLNHGADMLSRKEFLKESGDCTPSLFG